MVAGISTFLTAFAEIVSKGMHHRGFNEQIASDFVAAASEDLHLAYTFAIEFHLSFLSFRPLTINF